MALIKAEDPFGLTETEILKSASPLGRTVGGVYFLIKDGRIIYVGQSLNIYARLGAHVEKDFDAVAFIEVDEDIRNDVEAHYIITLNPERNGAVPRNGQYASFNGLRKLLPCSDKDLIRCIRDKNLKDIKGYYLVEDFIDYFFRAG